MEMEKSVESKKCYSKDSEAVMTAWPCRPKEKQELTKQLNSRGKGQGVREGEEYKVKP